MTTGEAADTNAVVDCPVSAPKTPMLKTARVDLRRSTRRLTTVLHIRQGSKSSIVQQKLHSAIQSGERTTVDLLQTQASFRARGVANATAAENDRSVSRYRNDAAIVSFCDLPSSSSTASVGFCYSTNFMPGVYFYTFLAAKGSHSIAMASTTVEKSAPTTLAAPPSDNEDDPPAAGVSKTLPGLRMCIPDTIVYGETGRAVLLYTDEHGIVQRSTEVTDKIVLDRLAVSSGHDLDPIVVCKEPTIAPAKNVDANALTYQGNLLRLLSPGELKTVLSNVSSSRTSKSFALQKYVRCNGSKAFIVRAVHEAGKPPYGWMINNTTPIATPAPTVSQVLQSLGQDTNTTAVTVVRSGSIMSSTSGSSDATTRDGPDQSSVHSIAAVPLVNRVCTSVQLDKSCTFIKLSERGCSKVAELNKRLTHFIERRLHLQLQMLVADYTKDTDGRWWLLQVKHFRVKASTNSAKLYYSLPRRLRKQYLEYRDSSILEETGDSDEEHDKQRRAAQVAAQMTQRQVQKLTQCKCCLAAYPKGELSFKMTLKMINEMLARIRSRLPPEKNYTFLAAALAHESTDPGLAYESWSVCSYCYAIYERDQQLQKVETKFANMLGAPDAKVMLAGLGKLDERAIPIDPTTTVLPSHLTLCRLMLVINGIYDIPPELYDAENFLVDKAALCGDTGSSHLYLRIAAFGFTECIPVDPSDICISHERAPRGIRRRRSSTTSSVGATDSDGSGEDVSDEGATRAVHHEHSEGRNYWLPIHLIRSIHFFAPRTPLHAKLKETSGLTTFLSEVNSINIQFVRATEPPLQDPTPVSVIMAERGRARRTALQPQPVEPISEERHAKRTFAPATGNHSVLLGATKLRMAQFRSAYVTKLDFYACMALTGEMFNIKGNLGLERVRYVDTKLLTSRYRLRAYNGVYIPDASYVPSDPLTSEWMDCLRAAAIPVPPPTPTAKPDEVSPRSRRHYSRQEGRRSIESMQCERIRQSISTTSLSAGNEEMDEELEHMIEDASRDHFGEGSTHQTHELPATSTNGSPDMASMKQHLLPVTMSPSRVDSQMAMLMNKPLLSPRSQAGTLAHKRRLWSLSIQLNHVHNLQSRERPYCRWECYYELFGQRRSAIEKSNATRPVTPLTRASDHPSENAEEDVPPITTEVSFSCTHRFFLCATTTVLAAYIKLHPVIVLNLRNDIYTSTRSRSAGEFFCELDMSRLMNTRGFDATVDVVAASKTPQLTPREAAFVSRYPPYLSLSVQLSEVSTDPENAIGDGDYVVVHTTNDGIDILKKIT